MISTDELKRFKIFSDLSLDYINKIGAIAHYKTFKKDSILKNEGETSAHFYIIKEGKIAFETTLYGDKTVRLGVAETEDYFGETSLIPPYKAFTTRRALLDSTMILINASDLKSLFDKEPKLGYTIMTRITAMLSGQLFKTRERLINCHFA